MLFMVTNSLVPVISLVEPLISEGTSETSIGKK